MSGSRPELVGMGVMGIVLGHPPAEAHSDQPVPDPQPEQAIGPPGLEDLPVARIVTEEAELGGDDPEEHRDAERGPRVAEEEEPDPSRDERGDREDDLDPVVAEPAFEEPRRSEVHGQVVELTRSGHRGS